MATMAASTQLLVVLTFLGLVGTGFAIQCYQCDSNEDNSCPSNTYFDRNLNALIDCNSLEAHTPGTFCMKISQQSPGWRAWTKITRRCGSRSEDGVAWGCRWFYEPNGVWREVCYCEDRDGCNTSATTRAVLLLTLLPTLLLLILRQLW